MPLFSFKSAIFPSFLPSASVRYMFRVSLSLIGAPSITLSIIFEDIYFPLQPMIAAIFLFHFRAIFSFPCFHAIISITFIRFPAAFALLFICRLCFAAFIADSPPLFRHAWLSLYSPDFALYFQLSLPDSFSMPPHFLFFAFISPVFAFHVSSFILFTTRFTPPFILISYAAPPPDSFFAAFVCRFAFSSTLS